VTRGRRRRGGRRRRREIERESRSSTLFCFLVKEAEVCLSTGPNLLV
jgi:hypothetical protein